MNAVLGNLVVTHSVVTEWDTPRLPRIVDASTGHTVYSSTVMTWLTHVVSVNLSQAATQNEDQNLLFRPIIA